MSQSEFPKDGTGGGPHAKKSNTWIIILVLVVVLGLPALCLCGTLAAWLGLRLVPWERGHDEVDPPQPRPSEIEFPKPRDPRPDWDSRAEPQDPQRVGDSRAEPHDPRSVWDSQVPQDFQPVLEAPADGTKSD